MLKVMTIVGTRPEIIKLSMVIQELDRHMEHVLVHTGQNYDFELNEIFFRDLGIRKPDYFMEAAASTPAGTIANVIARSDEIFEKVKPEALLIYGDTNSCLSVISAKRRKIPVFHMEAGNRCFDQRVPEEINRKIVDHLSDINLPLTEHARRYLLAEGIRPETIIKSGSCMKEILHRHGGAIDASKVLKNLGLDEKTYFVVSLHREENVDSESNFREICNALNQVADVFNKRVIFSVHPRTLKRLEREKGLLSSAIEILKPLGFIDYIALQKKAFCTISDSGTITEESSILGFPAITIRQAHERPEGMDEGTLIMSGLRAERVIESIKIVTEQMQSGVAPIRIVRDYDVENVSLKMVRVIQSYTDYINRTVWHKP